MLNYIFLKWAGITTFGAGLKAAAIIGFLMVVNADIIMYDATNFMNLTGYITDILIFIVMMAVVGGIIGAVLGIGNKSG